jgi:hypothetical protein
VLMRPEPPRQDPRRISLHILDGLINADFIALACFAASGLLITVLLAWIFPLERQLTCSCCSSEECCRRWRRAPHFGSNVRSRLSSVVIIAMFALAAGTGIAVGATR